MSEEKTTQGEVTKLFPERNNSGNTTMFHILQSHGSDLGKPQYGNAATINDKEKELLEKAIPASAFENLGKPKVKAENISAQSVQFKRGDVVQHTKTKKKVVIVKTDVDTDHKGRLRHLVCLAGTSEKFKVPEKNLRRIENGIK